MSLENLFDNFKKEDFLEELLAGKKISYVCPAPSDDPNNASKIDSRDIVCRVGISKHPESLFERYGKKTDIILEAGSRYYLNEIRETFNNEANPFPDLKCFISSRSDKEIYEGNVRILKEIVKEKYPIFVNTSYYCCISEYFCRSFQTGTLGLLQFLAYPIKELYITGMNFYNFGDYIFRKVYFEEYCDPPGTTFLGHPQYPQILFLLKLIRMFPSVITLDDFLFENLKIKYEREISILGIRSYFGLQEKIAFRGWPSFEEEDIEACLDVLRSGRVNQWTGDNVKFFEKEFSCFFGMKHAVALSNGTIALELALESLGIGEGDEVLVPSKTFTATGMAVSRMRATPVFCDIDLNSQCISPESIKEKISPRTKAIIVVHLGGMSCDMDAIMEISKDLHVIEDCAQCHGTEYKGKLCGTFGIISCWSFCQDKIITTGGEGGMILTNNSEIHRRIWQIKDHGKNIDKMTKTITSEFNFIHDIVGSNYRMTEMQAAIGRTMLKRLPDMIEKRRRLAEIYSRRLQNNKNFIFQEVPSYIKHSYYKYYIYLKNPSLKQRFLDLMAQNNIPCFYGSCSEIYKEKCFGDFPKNLPNAELSGQRSLMLLCHPTLTEEDIHLFCDIIGTFEI